MKAKAFTLVELLVVIAIISILLSLMSPTLARVQKLTRVTACQTNLHHIQIAYLDYMANWNRRLLPYICDGARPEAFWMQAIKPYYATADKVRCCPSVTKIDPRGWGTAYTAWRGGGFMGGNDGSYGISGWMYDMMPNYSGHDQYDWECQELIVEPQLVPVWFDCNWVDAWPSHEQNPVPDLVEGSRGGESSMGRVCILRHDWSVNVAFADGSAHNTKLEDLWLLKWHLKSVPVVRTVP